MRKVSVMAPVSTTPTTTIGLTRIDKAVILIGAPIVGLVLGWVLPPVAGWGADLPWIPYQGPFELVATWDASWVPLALMGAGAVVGLILAAVIFAHVLAIDVNDEVVTFRIGEQRTSASRRDVQAVFYEGKQVVLVDAQDRELLRGEPEGKRGEVESVFRQYGYRWLDADPYATQFQRWVPDHPDLPATANALLAARAVALKDDEADDAQDLRRELAALDVVVRDQRGRQYWRRSGGPNDSTRR